MVLIVGRFIGYLKKGSIASLVGGAGTGLIVVLAGFISLKAFDLVSRYSCRDRLTFFCSLILGYNGFKWTKGFSDVIAGALTLVMGQRFLQTQKIMPAGLVAGISALTTCFYVYKIATGGNHIPPKAE